MFVQGLEHIGFEHRAFPPFPAGRNHGLVLEVNPHGPARPAGGPIDIDGLLAKQTFARSRSLIGKDLGITNPAGGHVSS